MRGSIVRRGNGYSVVVELDRDPVTHKRRQKWHSGYPTKKAAERALAQMVSEVNAGTFVEKTRATVSEFAAEWLAAIKPTVRPSTHYSYSRNVRLHVLPYIGTAPLASVDAGTLNALYARLLTEGRKDQAAGSGLSPRSVRYVHTITHRMFKDAVRWGRLARNPADAADPPRGSASTRPEMATWTAEQLRTFLSGTAGHRLYAAWVLLATTGMRRGEVLGQRRVDLDLDHGRTAIRKTIIAVKHEVLGQRRADLDLDHARTQVRKTVIAVKHEVQIGEPKTEAGKRRVSLDPGTVAALRDHLKRQAAERLLIGPGWSDEGWLFCGVDGRPLHPERFSRTFADQARRLGLPPIRLHDLRHTWATLALEGGEHPKVVQERLGHANVSITLGTYSHVSATLHADAASRVAATIFGTGAKS